MITNEQRVVVSGIAKKFGKSLIESGLTILKGAFHLKPQVYTSSEIRGFLNQFNFPSISLADEKYYTETWETWKNLIKYDWTEEKEWYADKYDCDNHAFSFGSRIPEIFDLNTAGICFGTIYNKDTGKLIGGHAFNLIIALEDEKLTAYLFEPLTDKYVKWTNGDNILGDWKYTINWLILY